MKNLLMASIPSKYINPFKDVSDEDLKELEIQLNNKSLDMSSKNRKWLKQEINNRKENEWKKLVSRTSNVMVLETDKGKFLFCEAQNLNYPNLEEIGELKSMFEEDLVNILDYNYLSKEWQDIWIDCEHHCKNEIDIFQRYLGKMGVCIYKENFNVDKKNTKIFFKNPIIYKIK